MDTEWLIKNKGKGVVLMLKTKRIVDYFETSTDVNIVVDEYPKDTDTNQGVLVQDKDKRRMEVEVVWDLQD